MSGPNHKKINLVFLTSLKAYFSGVDNNLPAIIKYCRLEPVKSWRIWTDFCNYEMHILENHKISIKPIRDSCKYINDLYYKAHPDKLLSISRKIMVAQDDQVRYTWFLGNDDRIRASVFMNDEWIGNVAPLGLGLEALNVFVLNLDIVGCKDLNLISVKKKKMNKVWIDSV